MIHVTCETLSTNLHSSPLASYDSVGIDSRTKAFRERLDGNGDCCDITLNFDTPKGSLGLCGGVAARGG